MDNVVIILAVVACLLLFVDLLQVALVVWLTAKVDRLEDELAAVREELETLREFTRKEWAHPEEDKKEPPEEKNV